MVLVKFASDADRAAGVASLTRAIAPIPVTSAALPRDLASFGRVDGLPIAVAAILGVMAGAVLVYTLLTAIRRRRRDLAVLKALGFLRRDVARTVTVQAMTLSALALVIGLPIGVLLGRFVWRRFVDWQGIPSVPMVSLLALGLVGLAVLVVSALIAVAARAVRRPHLPGGGAPRGVGRGADRRRSVDGDVDERDAAADRGALAGCRLDRDAAADGADAVAHVHEAVARAARRVARSKPAPSSATSNSSAPSLLAHGRSSPRRPRPRACAAFCSASRQQK